MAGGSVLIDGRYLVGKRITQVCRGRGKKPDVTLTVEVDDSTHWRCTEVIINGANVLDAMVCGVPVGDLATAALARAAWVRHDDSTRFSVVNPNEQATFSVMRGRRRRATSVDLRRVADVYRAAVRDGSKAPVEQVAAELGVARSTAGRYVTRARRQAGLLPATTRGKVQA
jgi:hypothetical protein